MMQISLPLSKMTSAEKIMIMNEIWNGLLRSSEDIPSPEWHRDVLSARAKRVKNGTAHFQDFDSVKSELRSQFK
jgi:hypothetical protein